MPRRVALLAALFVVGCGQSGSKAGAGSSSVGIGATGSSGHSTSSVASSSSGAASTSTSTSSGTASSSTSTSAASSTSSSSGNASSSSATSAGSSGSTAGSSSSASSSSSSSGSTGASSTGSASSTASSSSTGGSSSGASSSSSSGGGSSGASCPAGIISIELSPASTGETISNGTASAIPFTALANTASGQVTLDPTLLAWSATRNDDANPGSVDANGVFQPDPSAGGTVNITATGCGQSGYATVTLTLDYTGSVDGGYPDGGNAGDATFSGALGNPDGGASASAPSIVYPSAETRFPRNVYKSLFQWKKNGSSYFRLTFTGPGSTVTVYTVGSHSECAGIANLGCWEADEQTWSAIASSNAGEVVSFRVDGTAGPGATVWQSASENLGFSRRDVKGAIFYWDATVGGIMRATVSDAQPEEYLVPGSVLDNGDTVSCAACHAISRDGHKLSVSGSATGPVAMNKGLWTMDITAYPPPAPIWDTFSVPAGDSFSAWAPDDERLIWSPRAVGNMYVVDGLSGQTLKQVMVGTTAITGTEVDWSPNPIADVMVYLDKNNAISTVTMNPAPDGGSYFTGPKTIATAIGGHADAFPSYLPEGDWVSFTNNLNTLYLVAADGGPAIKLSAANSTINNVLNNTAGNNGKENNMATWAPPGDLHWIAFNSQRQFGLVTTGGVNQIWVAAVDLSKIDGGAVDPSYPAFRLPFQNLTDKSHRAYWVLDIRDEPDSGYVGPEDAGVVGPPPDAGPCVATNSACDPATSTCCDAFTTGAYCATTGSGSFCLVP